MGRPDTDAMTAETLGRTPSPVDVEQLLRAARAAMAPQGSGRWFARPVTDGLEFRAMVKAWVDARTEPAREMRVACGAAVCASRLALVVQGRAPIVVHPSRPGLLGALSPGAAILPSDRDRSLYRAVHHRDADRPAPVTAERLRAALRCTADRTHAWFRTMPVPAPGVSAGLGPLWPGRLNPTPDGVVAVVGAPVTDRLADLRVGETVQLLRLLAVTLGWDLQVLAGPVRRDRTHLLGPGMPNGSLVLFRAEPRRAEPRPSGAAGTSGASRDLPRRPGGAR